ncbi:MAG: hypothetical protein L3J39_13985 [Verrucomicrobiales bacterium]|nr:hypothetical protein [Verrucomicrobiales bacterium]
MNPFLVAQLPPPQTDAPELPDIQDIVPPQAASDYGLLILALIGLLIFIVIAIFLAVHFIRKKQHPHQIPAGRVALKRLADLEPQSNDLPVNELSLQVSNILKDYLQARFHDPFRYETSQEFIHRLGSGASQNLPQSLQNDLARFTLACDELKFARPANADSKKVPLIEEARLIIREPITANAAPPVS